jgi:hypothetical protein
MSYLDKSQILGIEDLKREEVEIPEWGGVVSIRAMTAGERDAFEARQIKDPYKDVRARLAVASVCNASGELLFTEADVNAVTNKSAKALDRIFAVATKLSGLSKADVDELKKNSSTILSSDSSTS